MDKSVQWLVASEVSSAAATYGSVSSRGGEHGLCTTEVESL